MIKKPCFDDYYGEDTNPVSDKGIVSCSKECGFYPNWENCSSGKKNKYYPEYHMKDCTKICWQKSWLCFDYGWDDDLKTGISINSVSISISLYGYWIGISKQ
jgi:hypothetical protein